MEVKTRSFYVYFDLSGTTGRIVIITNSNYIKDKL